MRIIRKVRIKNTHTGIISIGGLVFNPGEEKDIDRDQLNLGSVKMLMKKGMLTVAEDTPANSGRA